MKPTIMIVDDSTAIAKVISMFLRNEYDTQILQNGKQALEQLRNSSILPRIIISDVNMPEMDGYVFLKELKDDDRLAMIPILMLSNIESSADHIRLLEMGASDFMLKPFNPEELRVRIKRIISK